MKRCQWLLLWVGLNLLPAQTRAQQWAGIIDPSRAIDWSKAGVKGGIPNRAKICAVLNPGATSSRINAAISECRAGQVVFLNAGTYGGLSGIAFNGKRGVTVRGAGADKTFLVFTTGGACNGYWADICINSSDTNWPGGPSNSANWTSGYSKGTTNITLDNYKNLEVGAPLILDQADDPSDTGSIYVCQSNRQIPPCSLEGNINNGQRSNRDQSQIVQVVSCGRATSPGKLCERGNITIAPGLYMPNWSRAKSPGAWWANSPASEDGVENLSLDHTNSKGNRGIEIFNCIDCWVSGVRSIDSGKAHVETAESARITIQNNYFYLTQNAIDQSYGYSAFNASDVLVVNNIIQYVAEPYMVNGACSGCVLAYNFSINDYYTASVGYMLASTNQHTAGIDNVLYEGNVQPQTYGDNFHGTHNFVTLFRNYWIGNQPACYGGAPFVSIRCNNNLIPVVVSSYSRYYNVIGNVLGQSGVHKSYAGGSTSIYSIGNGNGTNSITVPADPLAAATLMRWGNYDVVTGAVRWCGDSSDPGWTTICHRVSEVPFGLGGYANPVPSTTTLPASFYLEAKPSWWPAGKPWPPIGPDVRDGNISGVGGHAYTIPAQDCYSNIMGGPANGAGPVLTFNVDACYAVLTPGSFAVNKR